MGLVVSGNIVDQEFHLYMGTLDVVESMENWDLMISVQMEVLTLRTI